MKSLLYTNIALTSILIALCLIPGLTFTTEANRGLPERIIKGVVTGYSSEESQTDSSPYLTASQKQVQDGFIACPRKYEFGQKIEIQRKIYTCEDRKNIRYEDYPDEYFDIWFSETELALEFGIKNLEVVIK